MSTATRANGTVSGQGCSQELHGIPAPRPQGARVAARWWSRGFEAHSRPQVRMCGCTTAGWLSDESSYDLVPHPRRSLWVRRTVPAVRARPRVRMAVNGYSQQYAGEGALGVKLQMGQLVQQRRVVRDLNLSIRVNGVSEGQRARRAGSAGATTRCVFKAVRSVERKGRELDRPQRGG